MSRHKRSSSVDKKVVREERDRLLAGPIAVAYWVQRPYVVAIVACSGSGERLCGIGISKVCSPDRFNIALGKEMSFGRAVFDAAMRKVSPEHASYNIEYEDSGALLAMLESKINMEILSTGSNMPLAYSYLGHIPKT